MKHLATKHLLICTGLVIAAAAAFAQQPAPKPPPKSPAAVETATIGGKSITITYNSPGVKGREGHIFGKDGLIGKDGTYPVWRAGANAATVLRTDADLVIEGLSVPKGSYTLWVDVSDPDNWTLIVNKQSGQWGTVYDKSQDLGRVKFPTTTTTALIENLKYTIKPAGSREGTLNLAWEKKSATVPFEVH